MKFGKASAIFISMVLAVTSVAMPVSADEKQEEKVKDTAFISSAIAADFDEADGIITFTDDAGEIITVEGLSHVEEEELTGAGNIEGIVSGTYEQSEARALLTEINRFRTSSEDAWYYKDDTKTDKYICDNLCTLEYDYKLEKAAMQRAAEVAVCWGHTRPNGNGCFTAATELAIKNGTIGENLAAGTGWAYSPDSLLENLKETNYGYSGQGHRRNLLEASFRCIGMASITYMGNRYLVQEFGNINNQPQADTAVDGIKDMTISIAPSNITAESLVAASGSCSVEKGKVIALPELTHKINVAGVWGSAYAVGKSEPVWTSGDTSVASIVVDAGMNKVLGNAAGETELTASTPKYVSGDMMNCTVSVTVTDSTDKTSSSDSRKTSSSDSRKTSSSDSRKTSSSDSRKTSSSDSRKTSSSDSRKTSSSDSRKTSSSDSKKSGNSASDMSDYTENNVKKVPAIAGGVYAAPTDNFAAVVTEQNIGKQKLDFSRVKTSEVPKSNLCVTVIKGSKFTTSVPVNAVNSWDSKAIKAKIDKKTGCAVVAVKNTGSVNFTVGNDIYTVKFIVNAPKASKAYKKIPADSVIRKISMKELFGTDITGGTINVTSKVQGQATANNKDHTIVICPRQKDTVKVTYQYLNKKYKATITIK